VLEPAAEDGGAAVADWDARGASVLACGLRRRLAASWLKDAPGRLLEPAAEDSRATARRIVDCYVRAFILPN
jgi:hypothetical protein